ncbi:hypothetical protein GCM10020331_100890 [Ectobacillus funiculus]
MRKNIYLGREPMHGKTGWVNKKKMIADTEKLFQSLQIDLNPRSKMRELSVANMQMVEIATAISYNADLIIMDEPTSAITDKEVDHLFKIIDSLVQKKVFPLSTFLTKWMKSLRFVTILRYSVMGSM